MSRRKHPSDEQHPEYQRVARDPEETRRALLWIPPIAAAGFSIPLLWLAIRFSLSATSQMRNIVLLGADLSAGFTIAMYLFSAAGWLCLAGTLVSLLLAVRGKTPRRRIWCSVIALLFAGCVPVSWVFAGWV